MTGLFPAHLGWHIVIGVSDEATLRTFLMYDTKRMLWARTLSAAGLWAFLSNDLKQMFLCWHFLTFYCDWKLVRYKCYCHPVNKFRTSNIWKWAIFHLGTNSSNLTENLSVFTVQFSLPWGWLQDWPVRLRSEVAGFTVKTFGSL